MKELNYITFNKIINEITNNPTIYHSKTINTLFSKIKKEEVKYGISFIDGIRNYYDNSIPENERDKYYGFFLYFQGLSNCLANGKKK
jgi:hypothetical protein